jgi:hypothetical protein
MAIDTVLQDINGKRKAEVLDFNYCLAHLWPAGNPSFPLLQYVDPYGDAVFNGPQMPEVQRELDILLGKAVSDEQKDILCRIRELAVKCQKQPDMFLRFMGD